MKKLIFPIIFIYPYFLAQIPSGYYNETIGLTGYSLKNKLHEIISRKNISWHYGDLTHYYNTTDLDKYYDHGANNTSILLDMYSEIPSGPDAYEYTNANIIGSVSAEGQGWNREHMMPQSTFYSNYPMYSDLFYVVPTDARINQLRSNYPYGICSTASSHIFHTFTNTSKIGKSAIPNYSYTGRVYEPIDEFKGDIARSLLYFAVRYEGKLGTFKYNNSLNPASDTNPLDGTEERAYDPEYIAMLLQWHQQDPVSQKEKDRNNEVYAIQKNRNPFIDHPEWVNSIWGHIPETNIPKSPSRLKVAQTNAYFTTLQWNKSTSPNVIGYRIYKDGVLVASTRATSISIDHLTPSTSYTFTVKAYNNGYISSSDSNTVSVMTLASDSYSKDLFVSKYLEGMSNNKAIEITNRTGHSVNLRDYRLAIQLTSGGNYYFPASYELEGTVQHNETFVIINPNAHFSCYTINQAKFVTAAPQMTYSGRQYLELKYKSATVDALGFPSQNNSSILGNVSLYRKANINQPTSTFKSMEWDSYANNYCQNLGTFSSEKSSFTKEVFKIYPTPANESIFVSGDTENIQSAQIVDVLGKVVYTEKWPFRKKKNIFIHGLAQGKYILKLDHHTFNFIKK
ncbi:endonuclease [Chryseobacterium potabilaquae]|uniref:Extracellular ribonuclease n=1 Tax=Chryseobacterium potabilaquae TaxID=2675057 RepID=A0A6N4XA30_9FLAO|nr:endonuclease [Chryseobacterium potabilaquae]CAA7196243.1 Extracellular ribonuclease [Chryseobacterium potabilaquae]